MTVLVKFKKLVRGVAGSIIGRYHSGRAITVLPDDTFVVSYPKSGNTWTRFLIGNIIDRDTPVDFSNVEARIPDIYSASDHRLLKFARPRTLKSHEYFDPRYPRVIYIVRDPRDVAVSYYYHAIKFGKIGEEFSIERFVEQFVNGDIDRYGSWHDNVASWLHTRGRMDDFMLLRYEDILRDTWSELRRIAEFCGIQLSDAEVERAVELSSMERMRGLEKKQSGLWVSTRDSDTVRPFVRSGSAGGWRDELPEKCARLIESKWGALMDDLGYRL